MEIYSLPPCRAVSALRGVLLSTMLLFIQRYSSAEAADSCYLGFRMRFFLGISS